MQIVTFVLNPAVTIVCTLFLVSRERTVGSNARPHPDPLPQGEGEPSAAASAGRIVGSVVLGGFIAVLNMLGGMFAGCAIGGFDMR
jgi:hypothetical protein